MTIMVTGLVPGGNAEMDKQIMEGIGVSPGNTPAGALLRMAGPAEGGYRVITAWESQEAWETFRQERLEPFFVSAGRPVPSFEVSALDSFMVPR